MAVAPALAEAVAPSSAAAGDPFIESFIAPDMHMWPLGETVAYLEAGGLEVRDGRMASTRS